MMKKRTQRFVSVLISLILFVTCLPPAGVVYASDPPLTVSECDQYKKLISSSIDYTIAISSDRRVVYWGSSSSPARNVPTDLENVGMVAAGYNFALALTNDGKVVAWGDNTFNQCQGNGLTDVKYVTAGNSFALALKNDGTVIAWGDNTNGQCDIPAGLSGVVAIEAGAFHALALKSDGSVIAWGNNDSDWKQCEIPTDAAIGAPPQVVAFDAPWGHNLAIRSDGSVIAWGNNYSSQATVPSGITNAVAVSGSLWCSMVLMADGTVKEWGKTYSAMGISEPSGLTGVKAISSQQDMSFALVGNNNGYYKVLAWDGSGFTSETDLSVGPKIVSHTLAKDNSYIDVSFNCGIYGDAARTSAVADSSFVLDYQTHEGMASNVVISSMKRTDGTDLQGGEKTIRFYLNVTGQPDGQETIRINPAYDTATGNVPIFDEKGVMIEEAQTTGMAYLNTTMPRFVSSTIDNANTYVDVAFNQGVYGDAQAKTAISVSDFKFSFYRNEGTATSATLVSITNTGIVATTPASAVYRFNFALTGTANGKETIEIRPADGNSVFSISGEPMLAVRTTGHIPLSPPAPEIVKMELSSDNSYLDIFFNTGVYGDRDNVTDAGFDPVSFGDILCHIQSFGGGAKNVSISSFTKTDGSNLNGGETAVRLNLSFTGRPTGVEYFGVWVERLYNSKGIFYGSENTTMIKLNAMSPSIGLCSASLNNEYVDVNFNMGVYGHDGGGNPVPVDKEDFALEYTKGTGTTQSATIRSVGANTGSDPANPVPLSGGEKTVRVFLTLSNPATGGAGGESVKISPKDNGSIFSADEQAVPATSSTGKVTLNPSFPVMESYRLSGDNRYIDIDFNLGVYGDSAHTLPVSPSNFTVNFYTYSYNGGRATAAKIAAITRKDGTPLKAGDRNLRLMLGITGIPSGAETIAIYPSSSNPIYNSLGKSILMDPAQRVPDTFLNPVPEILTAALAGNLSYMDVSLSCGVYGDIDHTAAVSADDFQMIFKKNTGGTAEGVSILSVRKPDSENEATAAPLTGGETVLRFFLSVQGSQSGLETIQIMPLNGNSVYSSVGNPMAENQSAPAKKLAAGPPEIVSAKLANDNSYIDITFSRGVYGDSGGTVGLNETDFSIKVESNYGDVTRAVISSVKQTDGTTPPTGGEKALRLFLTTQKTVVDEKTNNTSIVATSASGTESIEISPANGSSIYSLSGTTMDAMQTTGKISLAEIPRIVSAVMAADYSYVDLTFSKGVYGAGDGKTPLSASSFQLYFERNGGIAANASIKSVRKPDGTSPASALALSGGEKTVRIFISVVGTADGKEWIKILPGGSKAIFDSTGRAMSADKSTGKLYLKGNTLQLVSAVIAEDNSYVDVNFNVGVYGAADGISPATRNHFRIANTDAQLASITKTDGTALTGGETTLRFNLSLPYVQHPGDGLVILPASLSEGPKVYNINGEEMPFNQTATVKFNEVALDSCELSPDNAYVDLKFSAGVYGDFEKKTPIGAEDIALEFQKNSGTSTGAAIRSVRKADSAVEANAGVLKGGESTVRVFLNVNGNPDGKETIRFSTVSTGVFGPSILAGVLTTGAISLYSGTLAVVSVSMGDDNAYVDVAFSQGIYGDASGKTPVDKNDFAASFTGGTGSLTVIGIAAVKKADGEKPDTASALTGGEKVVRIFLSMTGTASGSETLRIEPATPTSVYPLRGAALSGPHSLATVQLISGSPKIVSAEMASGSSYVDVTFNIGVYGATPLSPVTRDNFNYVFNANAAGGGNDKISVSFSSVKKADSGNEAFASALTGGEKKLRFFLKINKASGAAETDSTVPTGLETIVITPAQSIYSSTGVRLGMAETTGPVRLLAPELEFAGDSAAQLSSSDTKLQYIDVKFNTDVFGTANGSAPVDPSDFQIVFSSNSGNTTKAEIMSVRKPDPADLTKDSALTGGTASVRFYLRTYAGNFSPYIEASASGVETVVIKPKADSVFNRSGQVMAVEKATGTIRLANAFPKIVSAQMGPGNVYVDVTFSTGIYGNSGSTGKAAYYSDFKSVFSRNGGTASDAYINWAARPDSTDRLLATPLAGGEKIIRFFLTVSKIPSGVETIEIIPDSPQLKDAKGLALKSSQTTGRIRLITPYPPQWSLTGSNGEVTGWSSDYRISAGYEHTLVVKNDGTVAAFGNNSQGQMNVPGTLSGVDSVAAGASFSAALKRDGTLVGWGSIKIPDGLADVKMISAGSNTLFALRGSGDEQYISLIGDDYYRFEDIIDKNYYEEKLELKESNSSIRAISAGNDEHLLVLREDGTVEAYDYSDRLTPNYYGQCSVPEGLKDVRSVSAGFGFSLALKKDGTVIGWGDAKLPSAGIGNAAAISASTLGYCILKTDGTVEVYDRKGSKLTNRGTAVLEDVIGVSAGQDAYLFIGKDGSVDGLKDISMFGYMEDIDTPAGLNLYKHVLKGTLLSNSYLELELGASSSPDAAKLGIYSGDGFRAITAADLKVEIINGSQSLFGITIAGVRKVTRPEEDADAGDTSVIVLLKITGVPDGTETFVIKPASSFSIGDASGNTLFAPQTSNLMTLSSASRYDLYSMRIDAGWSHTVAMKEKGYVFNWGDNTYGQAPVLLSQDNASQVSAGYHHSAVLLHDGTVKVWGENYYGQLDMPGTLKSIVQISAGGYHTLALKSDGTVAAWGDNYYKQCTVPLGLDNVIAVSAGGNHSLALKSDGTVAAWGDNSFGQCSVPDGLNNVVAISAGDDFSLALKTDGTVAAWGNNSKGQISLPSGLKNVKAISAGYRHSLAILSDGTVTAWGDNSKGQCTVPSGLKDVYAVSAGTYHSVAMTGNGNITAWGDNSAGQTNVPENTLLPRVVSAVLADDNSYIDLQFNVGIYGLPDGTSPFGTSNLKVSFDGKSAGGVTAVTVSGIRKNDNTILSKASALTGGENIVRVFLSLTGEPKGVETVQLMAEAGKPVYDAYKVAMQEPRLTDVLTLKTLKQIKEITVDNTSSGSGTKYELVAIDSIDGNPVPVYDYVPAINTPYISWEHELKTGSAIKNQDGNYESTDSMLILGFYSKEKNHDNQELIWVNFNGKPAKFLKTAAIGDLKLDLYYVLGKDIPVHPGKYNITAYYRGPNLNLYGRAISLTGVAQMAPENLASTLDDGTYQNMCSVLDTKTDHAMQVDFSADPYNSEFGLKSTVREKADNYFTKLSENSYIKGWATASVSVRNAAYPVEIINYEPVRTYDTLPDLPAGSKIAFAQDKSNAADSNSGRQLSFRADGKTVTILSSLDGTDWKTSTCMLPDITNEGKAYTYIGDTEITDWAVYEDTLSHTARYVAVGNAWVGCYKPDGSSEYVTETYFDEIGHKQTHMYTYETSIKIYLMSSDGENWSAGYYPDFVFRTYENVKNGSLHTKFKGVVCNNNGLFVAYDAANVYYMIYSSSQWTLGKSFKADSQGNAVNTQLNYLTDLYTKNNMLVLTGKGLDKENLNLYWSTDGITWTQGVVAYKDPKFYEYDKTARKTIWRYDRSFSGGMTFAHNTFATSNGYTVAASQDGKNWNLYKMDSVGSDLVAFRDTFFRTVNYSTVSGNVCWLLSSEDLLNWYVEDKDFFMSEFTPAGAKLTTMTATVRNGFEAMTLEMAAPGDGETKVPVNSTLTLCYTDELKQGTDFKWISLKNAAGANVPISLLLDGENKTLSILPKADLSPITGYVLTIPEGALIDPSNLRANKLLNIKFTTGTSELPAITGNNLGSAEEPFDAGSAMELCYSREIAVNLQELFDKITVAPKANPSDKVQIDKRIEGARLILTPAVPLQYNTTYVISIPDGAVKDLFGNEAGPFSIEFVTGPDLKIPIIESTDPVDKGERVVTSEPICVYFSEKVTEGPGFSGVTLQDIREPNTTEAAITLKDETVDGIVKTTMLIQPGNELVLHRTYRVTIPADAVRDESDNPLASEYSFEFTEEIKKSYPVLVSTSPSDNATEVDLMGDIILTYDRPIRMTDTFSLPGASSIKSCDAGHSGVVPFTAKTEGRKLIITPNRTPPEDAPFNALLYGWTYELRYVGEGISDLYGNKDPEEVHTIRFTIETRKIASTLPGSDEAHVPLNAGIKVQLDPGFANPSKGMGFSEIKVLRADNDGGKTIYTEIASSALLNGNILYISPEENLSPLTTYAVEIPRGAIKGSGQSVNNYYFFSFTTGSSFLQIGNIEISNAVRVGTGLAEGETASFSAVGYPAGTEFVWDFGDGTSVSGASVSHNFSTRGEYNVMLICTNSGGMPIITRKTVGVLKRPDPASIRLDAAPSTPVAVAAGGSTEWIVSLKSGGLPVENGKITVSRSYPVTENRPPEVLATITTDENGYASYTGTLPEGVPEYYVKFTYENNYNGAALKKEVRRILKSAAGKVEVSGYVINDRNVAQAGASVKIGTTSVKTDNTGYYKISGLNVGTYTMRVSSGMHYDSVEEISLAQKSTVKNITLTKLTPSGNPTVNIIYINDTAPGYGKNYYFLQGIDAPIEAYALVDWKGHDPGYIEFSLNGNITKSTNMKLSLNAKDLKQGDQLMVACVTADDVRSPAVNARINIINSLPREFPVDLNPTFVGNKYVIDQYMPLMGISTPYIDSIPMISGGPISFLGSPAHVTGFMSLDGTFTATVGQGVDAKAMAYVAQNSKIQKILAARNAETQMEKDEINSRRSSSMFGSFEFSSNLDANFDWSYIPSTGRWQYLTGSITLNTDSEIVGRRSWGIKGVPLSVFLAGKFTLEMDSSLKSAGAMDNYTSGYLDFSKIEIEMSGGIDAFVASAGVYFAGGGKVRIDYPSKDVKYYIYVKGYAKLKALLWSVDFPFLEYGWGDDYETGYNIAMLSSNYGASLYNVDEEELKVMNRGYLGGQSGWQPEGAVKIPGAMRTADSKAMSASGGMAASAADSMAVSDAGTAIRSTLRSNTFPYTDQKLVPYNNGAFMVLLEDDPNRTSLNRTRASYSIYDGSSWTNPLPIDPKDETADFRPVAAATSGGVLAAWENLNEVLAEDASLGDALASEEIRVGYYDAATGKWNSPYDLTADSFLDHSPRIAASGHNGILTWIKSKSDSYGSALGEGYSAADEIMFSKWNGSSFSEPESIAAPDKRIIDSSVAFDGTTGAYVCTLDGDNDLTTTADREIYIMTYNGTTWSELRRITDNTISDSSPQVCIDKNGKAFVAWSEDKKVLYMNDAGSAQQPVRTAIDDTIVTEPFTMAVNAEGLVALVCPGKSSEGGQELYMMTYDPKYGVWSRETGLTSDQANNYSPSPLFIGNKLVTVYNRMQIVEETNPADGKTYPVMSECADLVMYSTTLDHDLAVSSDTITLSENNPYPGSLITIGATIKNNGMFTEPGAEAAFYYGDPGNGGTLIGKAAVSDIMVPGSTAYVDTEWEVPAGGAATDLFVVVSSTDKASLDKDLSNNTAVRKLVCPDLEISALTYAPVGEGKYALTATVKNVGSLDVTNAVLTFERGDASNQLQALGTADTGALAKGETKDILYLWTADPSVWIQDSNSPSNGKVDIFASVEIPDSSAETVLENNVQSVTLLRQSLNILTTEPANYGKDVDINSTIRITYDSAIVKGSTFEGIALKGSDNITIAVTKTISEDTLTIQPKAPLGYDRSYTLLIPASAVLDAESGVPGAEYTATFNTKADPGGTDDPGTDDPDPTGSGTGTNTGNEIYAAVASGSYRGTIEVRTDESRGLATASLDEEILRKSGKALSIRMPVVKGVTSYSLQVPVSALSAEKKDHTIQIICANGTVTLPGNMLEKDQIGNHETVTVSMESVSIGKLSPEVQKLIGGRPVIKLKLMAGDEIINWNNPDAPVTVSIPYAPSAAELADPDKIVIWYIDGSGRITPVYSGRYDQKTGTVTYTTTHFSYFAVAYGNQSITDLKNYGWAEASVEALAVRGILNGMSETKFTPGKAITRAEFVCLLVRTLGLSSSFESNFSDVDRKAYYYNEIGVARKFGIAQGDGGRFRPDDRITRQDMMVLTVRALEKSGELKKLDKSDTLTQFSDKKLLSKYAIESAEYAVSAGLIQGSNGRLNPMGYTTRAEAAVILYRLFKSR
ncbi:MAG TPA: Ig-like domain-containing protein [Clostridia bacterium]|nr:Ig-like domain-containing protein [Clostridia bacterium]